MPPASADGPAFPVIVDKETLAEDLAHASESARAAIEPMVARLEDSGAPARWLKRCEEEARDGTSLPGCVKMYIPRPGGQWGAVFLGTTVNGTLTLILLAVGERHPAVTWRPSVYQVADRRLDS